VLLSAYCGSADWICSFEALPPMTPKAKSGAHEARRIVQCRSVDRPSVPTLSALNFTHLVTQPADGAVSAMRTRVVAHRTRKADGLLRAGLIVDLAAKSARASADGRGSIDPLGRGNPPSLHHAGRSLVGFGVVGDALIYVVLPLDPCRDADWHQSLWSSMGPIALLIDIRGISRLPGPSLGPPRLAVTLTSTRHSRQQFIKAAQNWRAHPPKSAYCRKGKQWEPASATSKSRSDRWKEASYS
jgi:hypothetical protein